VTVDAPRPTSTLVKGAHYGKAVLVTLAVPLAVASWWTLVTPAQAPNVATVWGLWGLWLTAFGGLCGVEVGGIAYRDGKSGGLTGSRGDEILAMRYASLEDTREGE